MTTPQRPAPPPLAVHRAGDRGLTEIGWLHSRHSFSFGDFYDPARMGVGPLRVLNDDRVAPGAGFGAHPHRDMEIVSYVLEGALRHEDSAGHGGTIPAGEVQFMRAGSGIFHSEMNASPTERVHFLQIWMKPRTRGLPPTYDQFRPEVATDGTWTTLASGGRGGITIDQDAAMMTTKLTGGATARHTVAPGRQAYLFVIEGSVLVHGTPLRTGDAVHAQAGPLEAQALEGSHLLLFDLPPQ